ncbi:Putative NAD(P)H nitroreductase YfkO [Arenibacter antarcticus]|uniref:Nitroreductase family protein n=1 Tax=Arenibacter antarcticus TaxID=2040469 RepID=A0ABW5VGH6_9FLAO|nr:nitroreductase family protein [Arenibacter sp. H213]MCM4166471.1 NAD(P)H-dependent oxidoreductase [Arenibacter sp. H213]
MDIKKQLEWRYAVKKFDSDELLTPEKREILENAFNLTATSFGLQPIRLVVVQNKKLQKELVGHTYGQQQVAQASHVFVICIEQQIDKEFIHDYFKRVQQIRNTSDEILNPFKGALVDSFSKKEMDEVRVWATNQAYLALGTLLTVCALEGVDSCPMEGFNPSGYDTLLGLEKRKLTSVLVLPVGYRAKDDMFAALKKVRKNLKDSIINIS